MTPDYDIVLPTEEKVSHVWDNMREYDVMELSLQKYKKAAAIEHAMTEDFHVLEYKGEPVHVGGVVPIGWCNHVVFYATNDFGRHYKAITEVAKGFFPSMSKEYWDRILMVTVWEKHRVSMRWLQNLGLTRSKARLNISDEPFVVMEWRK